MNDQEREHAVDKNLEEIKAKDTKFHAIMEEVTKHFENVNELHGLSDEQWDSVERLYRRLCRWDAMLQRIQMVNEKAKKLDGYIADIESIDPARLARVVAAGMKLKHATEGWDPDDL